VVRQFHRLLFRRLRVPSYFRRVGVCGVGRRLYAHYLMLFVLYFVLEFVQKIDLLGNHYE
jgi:hypothetical protein